MTVLAALLAKLPTAVPLARVEVGSVSAMYIDCSGVQPNEKTMPKIKMKATVVLAADVLSGLSSESLLVPVMTAKQQEQKIIE